MLPLTTKPKRNRTTARLRQDAEQHARSVKETLEAEYGDRLAAALEQSEEAAALSSTAHKKAARLGRLFFDFSIFHETKRNTALFLPSRTLALRSKGQQERGFEPTWYVDET